MKAITVKTRKGCTFTCIPEEKDWNFLTMEDKDGHDFYLYPDEAKKLRDMLNKMGILR